MINKIRCRLKLFYIYRTIAQSGVFDHEYYFRNNLDVARDCLDPIKHYVQSGWREGRNPAPHFDTQWYLETYPDVRQAGVNPLYHYIRCGANENRDPSPTFSTTDYLASHPELLASHINPLAHIRQISRSQGLLPQIPFELFTSQPVSFPELAQGKHISIVIPIYNAYGELEKLLETVYANSDIPFLLIAVNDASTDGRIAELLASYARQHDNFIILENSDNLGFAATVNRGLQAAGRDDCVIVNTDVEVPKNWLSRLVYPLRAFENVATVTPMSNSATLMSFPKFGHNVLPEGLSPQQIDDIFKKLNPTADIYIEAPTGHGFCMAMSRKAIEQVGVFDTIYGKGYGEENDWCMKAFAKGFRSLIAPNLFVYHKHTASFTDQDREKYIRKNSDILKKRYPDYEKKIRLTPLDQRYRNIRESLLLLTTAVQTQNCVLRFENMFGGGSSFACRDYTAQKQNDEMVLLIRPSLKAYTLDAHHKDYHRRFSLKSEDEIAALFTLLNIEKVIVNQLVGYRSLKNIFSAIEGIKAKFNPIIEYNIRDFFCICPQFNLMCMGQNFCTLDGPPHCTDCFTQAINALGLNDTFQTIDDWRQRWSQFLCSVDHLVVFSNFTKSMFIKGYPEHEHKVIVSSIPVHYLRKAAIKKPSNSVHIAVIGNINYVKGTAILREMLDMIKTDKTIKLFLFGKTNDLAVREGIINKGEYQREDLPELMEQNHISIIFIPSIWGETFCRTAQEAIAMDIPLAVFDIEAPPERVRMYDKGLVISEMNAACALSQMVEFVKTLPDDRSER